MPVPKPINNDRLALTITARKVANVKVIDILATYAMATSWRNYYYITI